MHLTSTSGTTPDVPLNPLSPRAWLSPYKWAHLQVRYFTGTNPISGTNLYWNYALLEMNNVPTARFRRQAIGSWQPFTIESTSLPSAQMRQLPVIVLPSGSTEADRAYEVVVRNHGNGTLPPLQRADVSIDDFGTADVVRLLITHESLPSWTPTLYINDDPVHINANGNHPFNLPPLLPPTQGGPAHPGPSTSYRMRTLAGVATIDLRLVKPSNTNRAHRVSIAW